MYSLLPFWLRRRLNALQLMHTYLSCDCTVCDAFYQHHHRSCCDCRSCRRYSRRHGHCLLCSLNPTPRP